jgi:hypothetical protein
LRTSGQALDISGCGADNFQVADNEMAPHINMFRAMAPQAPQVHAEKFIIKHKTSACHA